MQFDMVIVGGGMVGSGFACALRETKLSIAIIDACPLHQPDARLFALNYSSCQFLKNLSVWDKIFPFASPIHQVHISSRGQFGAIRLNREDVSLPSLGHVVPAHYIEQALQAQIMSSDITSLRPAKVISLQQNNDGAELNVEIHGKERKISAPLIIAADGACSTIRNQLNISTKHIDYQQSAIVVRTILSRSHQQIAYERFTKDGAIAMLPLPQNNKGDYECATIWSAKQETVHHLLSLPPASFLAELQTEFGYRLGKLKNVAKRFSYPLRMVLAEQNHKACVFLLGNAAHTLHPIAAQGFNLALYEVAAFAEKIKETLVTQQTIRVENLREINAQFKNQQTISTRLSHRLPQLFNHSSLFFSALRPFAMMGMDIAAPIKKQFIKRILGRSGRVPSLLLPPNE